VNTPFQFDDGDHYVVVLKREGDKWVLTDEGHTFMHLSYSDLDLTSGTRGEMIDEAILQHKLTNNSGELRLTVPGSAYGDALFSFVQAIGRIATTALWTRERVKSTFVDDFAHLIETVVPMDRREFNYADPVIDPDKLYRVDYKISSRDRDYLVFGVRNDDQTQQATIACLQYERAGKNFRSVVIFEDQAIINRRLLAQLTNVASRQFASLADKQRIKKFFEEEVLGNNHHN